MKDSRIAVLHVLSDGSFGGALSHLTALFSSGDHRRFRYGVILPRGSEAERKLAPLPVTVIALDLQKRSFSARDLCKLGQSTSAFAPDIVQTHGALGARVAAFFAAPHAFLLLTKHCVFESSRSRCPLLARALSFAARPFTHLSVATATCAEKMLLREGAPASSVLTVQNGAPPKKRPDEKAMRMRRQALALPLDCLTVGFCGRLEKEKNPRFLLSLARALAAKGISFCVLVIGDGSQRAMLEEQSKRMGLGAHFRFVGYQSDPALDLSLCDVQINCSLLSETSSLALSEGFALGIPALASSLPGNREMIRQGENGLLYPKGDVRACASLLARLSADRSLLKCLSRGAQRAYRQRFSSALMAKRYECLYRALVRHSSKKD